MSILRGVQTGSWRNQRELFHAYHVSAEGLILVSRLTNGKVTKVSPKERTLLSQEEICLGLYQRASSFLDICLNL